MASARSRAGAGALTSVTIRRAEPGDVDFLVELTNLEEVEPFMSARRPRDRDALLAEIERSQSEPREFGRFVIEVDGRLAGAMGFQLENERSRIAHLGGLAVHPDFRGGRVSDEAARQFQRHLIFDLGYHRLQLEIYGFNERAMRHAERVGFVREGVRRKAYRRHGEWVDGVLYGLVQEDLAEHDARPDDGIRRGLPFRPGARGTGARPRAGPGAVRLSDLLARHVERFNSGVRTGDWEPMLEQFGDAAELEFRGVPVGPFAGKAAIRAAYRDQPPDDELRVLESRVRDGVVEARYAWLAEPDVAAGELLLESDDGLVRRLVVTFDRDVRWS